MHPSIYTYTPPVSSAPVKKGRSRRFSLLLNNTPHFSSSTPLPSVSCLRQEAAVEVVAAAQTQMQMQMQRSADRESHV